MLLNAIAVQMLALSCYSYTPPRSPLISTFWLLAKAIKNFKKVRIDYFCSPCIPETGNTHFSRIIWDTSALNGHYLWWPTASLLPDPKENSPKHRSDMCRTHSLALRVNLCQWRSVRRRYRHGHQPNDVVTSSLSSFSTDAFFQVWHKNIK